jgi:hypothetical protein
MAVKLSVIFSPTAVLNTMRLANSCVNRLTGSSRADENSLQEESVMRISHWRPVGLVVFLLPLLLSGCGGEAAPYALDQDVARNSVQKAMQAWVDGKQPKELQPEIVVGDQAWEKGRRLADFEVLSKEETTDGSNLHIRVLRTFDDNGVKSKSRVTYIVGTTPVITIFPQ